MKIFKNLFYLSCCCFILFAFQNCNKDETELIEQQELAQSSDSNTNIGFRTNGACWEMMNDISYGFGHECASNSAQLVEEALNNYVSNPNDETVYNAMFAQIGYFLHLLTCDNEYECYNCEDYLALAYSFAQCLEEEESEFAGWLDSIIGTLEDKCSSCVDDPCCDEVSLNVSSVPHPTKEDCCLVSFGLDDPSSCTEGLIFLKFLRTGAQVPWNNISNTFTHCKEAGPVQVLVDGCLIEEIIYTSDCEPAECCDDGLIITQEPHPTNEGCCYVYVTDPCEDEFTVIETDANGNTQTSTYTKSRTLFLCQGETLQVTDDQCFFDSGIIESNCEECCEDTDLIVNVEEKGACCVASFTLSGCDDGWMLDRPFLQNPIPISGVHFEFDICFQFQGVRIFNKNCPGIDSGMITNTSCQP